MSSMASTSLLGWQIKEHCMHILTRSSKQLGNYFYHCTTWHYYRETDKQVLPKNCWWHLFENSDMDIIHIACQTNVIVIPCLVRVCIYQIMWRCVSIWLLAGPSLFECRARTCDAPVPARTAGERGRGSQDWYDRIYHLNLSNNCKTKNLWVVCQLCHPSSALWVLTPLQSCLKTFSTGKMIN